jgi:glucose/mannose-6-phosphate isomerase
MTRTDLKRLDPSGMYDWIRNFPDQIEDAVRIGTKAPLTLRIGGLRNIVVTGLGGSAIGGDVLRSYLANELPLPVIINRHYRLPEFVDTTSLVIVSSYSGNTEETIAAHADAVQRKARVLCITTNGTTMNMAKKFKQPVIAIPPGLPPRAALGYSFFPLLIAFSRLRLIKPKTRDIAETVKLLRQESSVLSDPQSPDNTALQLARSLRGKLPVLYAPTEHLDAVAVRWRGQLSENAKQLAFGHVLPEMNHNELVGWKHPRQLLKQMHVIFLRDAGTHKRIALRETITQRIVSQYAGGVTELWTKGTSLLARIFSLIHLGDWTSFYLALLNNEDPTPVRVIDEIKQELGKV